jgi:hypothetical protein
MSAKTAAEAALVSAQSLDSAIASLVSALADFSEKEGAVSAELKALKPIDASRFNHSSAHVAFGTLTGMVVHGLLHNLRPSAAPSVTAVYDATLRAYGFLNPTELSEG